MKYIPKTTPFLVVLLFVLLASACGGPANESGPADKPAIRNEPSAEPQSIEENNALVLSPCGVTSEMVGQEMDVSGRIEFIDRGDPQGLFVGLAESGCMLGAFIEKAAYNQWSESQQAAVHEGEQATFSGTLTKFGGELVLEVYAQQEAMEEVEVSGGGDLASLSIQVSDNPDSRWQEITITVLDDSGQPVGGVPISITQSDIDFIHSASNTVWASWITEDGGWSEDAEEQMQRYRDMGTNNWEFLPWWSWKLYEPADDQWEFYSYSNDWQFTDRPYWQEFFPDARFNTMWVGPQFDRKDMVPSWVDYQDDETFRAEFGEFIREAIKLNPTGHFDLYGLTVEINDAPTWDKLTWDITEEEWDWAIDFIAWEADLIRSLDPDARISIDFDQYPPRFDDCEPCIIENWIDRIIAAGIEFDVIGIEIHPGVYAGSPSTVEEMDAFIQGLDVYGKDYYIWEFAVRSHGEPMPTIIHGKLTDPSVMEYTEENQSQITLDFIRYAVENPRFLGIRYLKYMDSVTEDDLIHMGEEYRRVFMSSGLLREDRTPKPAYFAVRDYMQSLYYTGEGNTDDQGRFSFNAIPGIFELGIAGESAQIHLWVGSELNLSE